MRDTSKVTNVMVAPFREGQVGLRRNKGNAVKFYTVEFHLNKKIFVSNGVCLAPTQMEHSPNPLDFCHTSNWTVAVRKCLYWGSHTGWNFSSNGKMDFFFFALCATSPQDIFRDEQQRSLLSTTSSQKESGEKQKNKKQKQKYHFFHCRENRVILVIGLLNVKMQHGR